MNFLDLIAAIKLLGRGMLAVFVVMVIIAILIYLFTKH